MAMSQEAQNLNWLISEFVKNVPGVRYVVVVAADGLPLTMSSTVSREHVDRLAALTSGLVNLAQGASRFVEGDGVKQTVIEMGKAFLLIMSVSDGSSLAVIASSTCDIGLVGYQTARLVKQAGELLTPALRNEMQSALPK